MATEKRLIDADALISLIKRTCCNGCKNYEGVKCRACEHDDAIAMIEDAPTVNAVEVVHGRWETANDGTHFCSNCGCDATYTWDDIDRSFINSADDVPDRITNFCQNCGAKMDGGADNAVD